MRSTKTMQHKIWHTFFVQKCRKHSLEDCKNGVIFFSQQICTKSAQLLTTQKSSRTFFGSKRFFKSNGLSELIFFSYRTLIGQNYILVSFSQKLFKQCQICFGLFWPFLAILATFLAFLPDHGQLCHILDYARAAFLVGIAQVSLHQPIVDKSDSDDFVEIEGQIHRFHLPVDYCYSERRKIYNQ